MLSLCRSRLVAYVPCRVDSFHRNPRSNTTFSRKRPMSECAFPEKRLRRRSHHRRHPFNAFLLHHHHPNQVFARCHRLRRARVCVLWVRPTSRYYTHVVSTLGSHFMWGRDGVPARFRQVNNRKVKPQRNYLICDPGYFFRFFYFNFSKPPKVHE